MRLEYNITSKEDVFNKIKDFLDKIPNYIEVKSLTLNREPKYVKNTYDYMVYKDKTHGVFLIFFHINDWKEETPMPRQIGLVCSLEWDDTKEFWQQSNIHFNAYKEFESNDYNRSTGVGLKCYKNFMYFMPAPTLQIGNKLVANYNSKFETVMFSMISDIEIPYKFYEEKHIDSYTRNMVIGFYSKYNPHYGGFYYAGDYVYTYEIIYRSTFSGVYFSNKDLIEKEWESGHDYKIGNSIRKPIGDNDNLTKFYRCIVDHRSADDVFERDLKNNIPKWEELRIPGYYENLNFDYAYIDAQPDPRFIEPLWHTRTNYSHSIDWRHEWVDYPSFNLDSIRYSNHKPNNYDIGRLEVLALAAIDNFPNIEKRVGDRDLLTDTNLPSYDPEMIEKIKKLILEKESYKEERRKFWDDKIAEIERKFEEQYPEIMSLYEIYDTFFTFKDNSYESRKFNSLVIAFGLSEEDDFRQGYNAGEFDWYYPSYRINALVTLIAYYKAGEFIACASKIPYSNQNSNYHWSISHSANEIDFTIFENMSLSEIENKVDEIYDKYKDRISGTSYGDRYKIVSHVDQNGEFVLRDASYFSWSLSNYPESRDWPFYSFFNKNDVEVRLIFDNLIKTIKMSLKYYKFFIDTCKDTTNIKNFNDLMDAFNRKYYHKNGASPNEYGYERDFFANRFYEPYSVSSGNLVDYYYNFLFQYFYTSNTFSRLVLDRIVNLTRNYIEYKKIELNKIQNEIDELKRKLLELGDRGDELTPIYQRAAWCSTTRLGNCVPARLSLDDRRFGLPDYSGIIPKEYFKVNNNYNTLNGVSLIMPIILMVLRQPVEEDVWSALGKLDIINYVNMYNISTNSLNKVNYPYIGNIYNCFNSGFRRMPYGSLGYTGLAFKEEG